MCLCSVPQLAEELLVKETLNYDDVVALIGPPKYDAATRKIESFEFEASINSLAGSGSSEKPNDASENDTADDKK